MTKTILITGATDGIDLARMIRSEGSEIPFILLSCQPQVLSEPALAPIEQLLKPVSLRVLRAKLDELMSLSP